MVDEAKTTYDESLFDSQEEANAAEALFNQGQELAGKQQPEGSFQAKINEASMGKAQSSGRLQAAYEVEIIAGPHKGTKLYKYDGFGSDKQAQMSLNQLAALGVDSKKLTLAKLPATLMSLKGKAVQIQCKQNGEFYNIYFRKAINAIKPGTTQAGGTKKF